MKPSFHCLREMSISPYLFNYKNLIIFFSKNLFILNEKLDVTGAMAHCVTGGRMRVSNNDDGGGEHCGCVLD